MAFSTNEELLAEVLGTEVDLAVAFLEAQLRLTIDEAYTRARERGAT
jgi:hypothetical protein